MPKDKPNSLGGKLEIIQAKQKKLLKRKKALKNEFLCALGRLMQKNKNNLSAEILIEMKRIYEKYGVKFIKGAFNDID